MESLKGKANTKWKINHVLSENYDVCSVEFAFLETTSPVFIPPHLATLLSVSNQ